jgi:dTDP-4-dehydrorhamnose 3,5-epimerase
MELEPLALAGAYRISTRRFQDDRGFFTEAWRADIAARYGLTNLFTRTNMSFNRHAGTIRGLHMQRVPHAEVKLVRCVQGRIMDVLVDVRPSSETCGQWLSLELSADNGLSVYIPEGFLHGFQTLVNDTMVLYQVTGCYTPEAEQGARFDDAAFGVLWGDFPNPVLSGKDLTWKPWGSA